MTPLVLEQRHCLQVFSLLFFSFQRHYLNVFNRQVRTVSKCMNFLNWLHRVDDTGSTGDAEEYEREFETGLFDVTLFAPLVMLFW